jgi:hypothetical protein
MAQSGGRQFDTPDFNDSVPPDPAMQGDAGDANHVMRPPTVGGNPRLRMSMASPTHIDLPLRSTTPPGVGGTFMPGGSQGSLDKGTEERSSAA